MIYSIGIGPGDQEYMTPQALKAIEKADVVVGYNFYVELIEHLLEGKEVVSTGMMKEIERAQIAFDKAANGATVAVVSSGDSGVYGMASLLWEIKMTDNLDTDIEVVAGISAMFAAAAKLGAPLAHDFCSVSMSNLLTPWEVIDERIKAAAKGDFITAVYNPVSKTRYWQIMRLKELFLEVRDPETPVGFVRHVGREEESVRVVTLGEMDASMADMFTVVIIGNSQTKAFGDKMITPRGYSDKYGTSKHKIGRAIMNKSFQTILKKIDADKYPLEQLWTALHCIHTTADFSIIDELELTDKVIETCHQKFYSGKPPVIVTDVNMVTKGIRKSIVEELGIQVKCYLDDERVAEMADKHKITRTQAGIRLAVEEHPDALFAFGNAPTALIELIKLVRSGKANPSAVVAAPVGFVNVRESKWQLKYGCKDVPAVILHGRKGGSNVAATIINSMLSWSDAQQMEPGTGL
ncbi:precorrin-3B C(17)-methyltransferase [Labilibacter marinus]|uniref:precorrin-3B C(17)-methyltransferase n=1 Tax=Labilibacter marinus TaxID=1477105 RepID=UPI0008298F6E|nr:precorrin-3B C(17)-methyltransferase [Labilibacter marinus]